MASSPKTKNESLFRTLSDCHEVRDLVFMTAASAGGRVPLLKLF